MLPAPLVSRSKPHWNCTYSSIFDSFVTTTLLFGCYIRLSRALYLKLRRGVEPSKRGNCTVKTRIALLSVLGVAIGGLGLAAEGPIPNGVPRLDHVFVIMMENHGYGQV